MIHQHAVRPQPGERAVVAVRDAADVVVVADAHEHELGALGRLARRRRGAPAILVGPGCGLLGGAVVHAHVVAFGPEVSGHRIAHDAEPDEGALGHVFPPSLRTRGKLVGFPRSGNRTVPRGGADEGGPVQVVSNAPRPQPVGARPLREPRHQSSPAA